MRVSILTIQDHNLDPGRESELARACTDMGMTLVAGFAPPRADGTHWGGVLMLMFDSEVKLIQTVSRDHHLVRVIVSVVATSLLSSCQLCTCAVLNFQVSIFATHGWIFLRGVKLFASQPQIWLPMGDQRLSDAERRGLATSMVKMPSNSAKLSFEAQQSPI